MVRYSSKRSYMGNYRFQNVPMLISTRNWSNYHLFSEHLHARLLSQHLKTVLQYVLRRIPSQYGDVSVMCIVKT